MVEIITLDKLVEMIPDTEKEIKEAASNIANLLMTGEYPEAYEKAMSLYKMLLKKDPNLRKKQPTVVYKMNGRKNSGKTTLAGAVFKGEGLGKEVDNYKPSKDFGEVFGVTPAKYKNLASYGAVPPIMFVNPWPGNTAERGNIGFDGIYSIPVLVGDPTYRGISKNIVESLDNQIKAARTDYETVMKGINGKVSGIIVITKGDLISRDVLEAARKKLLNGSKEKEKEIGLYKLPIVITSAKDGTGLENLVATMSVMYLLHLAVAVTNKATEEKYALVV